MTPKPVQPKPVTPVTEKKAPSVEIDKSISTYNGAKTDKYNWSQHLTQVDLQIKLPKGTTAKMLDIKIKPKHLRVAIKGQDPIIDGELD